MNSLLSALTVLVACSGSWHADQARDALDRGDLAAAEEHYRSALDREPALDRALWGLGWTYHMGGRIDDAELAFKRCAEALPASAECERGLGTVALSRKDLDGAKSHLERARALAPEDPGVQNSLALLAMSSGDSATAEALYRDLADRHPDLAEFRIGIAEVLLRTKRPNDAIAQADAGLALPSANTRYRNALLVIRARALVAATSDRIDPRHCDTTRPPVVAWLDAAGAALDEVEKSGVPSPDVPAVRKSVERRRAAVDARCAPATDPAPDPATGPN